MREEGKKTRQRGELSCTTIVTQIPTESTRRLESGWAILVMCLVVVEKMPYKSILRKEGFILIQFDLQGSEDGGSMT